MSRVAPTSGSKLLYFLCICISGLFIYMDLNYKSFEGIKHTYKSFEVSSNYFLKLVTVDLVSDLHQMTKQKSQLIAENKKLKLELDNSYLDNFIISNDSKFFADDQSIQNFLNLNKITKTFHLAKIDYFDAEQFLCCSKHRFFIETYNPHDLDFLDSPVINKTGILGQIINTESIYEVLLLTDTSHVMPIFSGNNFCNARGSGNPGLIKCAFNSLIWEGSVEIGQEFFSSGMGGVYPKGVLIGEVSDIREIEENIFEFDINLTANPLDSNVVGVIENL